MKIVYTRHAKRKFVEERYVEQLKITKNTIRRTLQNPILEDKTRGEKITAVGEIDKEHRLIVIYRVENNSKKVITFFPTEKGRYESKILQRR